MSVEDRAGGEVPVPACAGPSQAGRGAAIDRRRLARWGIRSLGALGVLIGTVILVEFVYYRSTRSMTNDAFVETHIVHIAPREAGWLTRVLVEEHDAVKTGQLVAEVDPVPWKPESAISTLARAASTAARDWARTGLYRIASSRACSRVKGLVGSDMAAETSTGRGSSAETGLTEGSDGTFRFASRPMAAAETSRRVTRATSSG